MAPFLPLTAVAAPSKPAELGTFDERDRRISELERTLVAVEAELTALHQGRDPSVGPPPPGSTIPPGLRPPTLPPPPPIEPGPPSGADDRQVAQLAERLLRIVGVALVVLAVGFFVSTAISRGWIGPAEQLALATVTSLAIVAQSFRFGSERRAWRTSFAAGGSFAFLLAGAIGFHGLELLTFDQAFAWFSAAIALVFALARLHDSELVAGASIPSFLVGVFSLSLFDEMEILMTVTAAVYVGVLSAVTFRPPWPTVRLAGTIVGSAVAVLALVIAVFNGAGSVGLVVAYALAVAATASIVVPYSIRPESAPTPERRGRLLGLLEQRGYALFIPWLALMTATLVDALGADFSTGVSVGITGLVAGLMVTLAGSSVNPTMTVLHQAAAVATMALGAVIALEGPALLVALTMQAVLTVVLAARSRSPELVLGAVALGGFATLGFMYYVLVGALEQALTTGEIVAVGVVAIAGAATGWMLRDRAGVSIGWAYGWLALLGWFASVRLAIPEGDVVVSLLWAALGIAMVVGGSWLADRPIIGGGLATLALTVAKLLVIDLASVDVLWRAGLFLAVGAGLLRLGFVAPRLAERVGS